MLLTAVHTVIGAHFGAPLAFASALPLLADVRARPMIPFQPDWSLHPTVIVGTLLLGASYFWGIGPWRRRHGHPPAPLWRVALFLTGLAVILVSLNGPIHDLSDYYLFSIHMVQHLLLTLVLPPLLIAGLPGWLADGMASRPWARSVGRVLTHPLAAGMIFTVTLTVWHLVPMYDLMMRNHEVHVATHLMFMVAAVIMWWPALSPSTVLPPLPYGLRALYLFLVSIPMQLVAAIITFADDVLYDWYAVAPRTWGLSPNEDQQLGGLLMWVPGNMYMLAAIAAVFYVWAKQDA
jgi:putative membrane protein